MLPTPTPSHLLHLTHRQQASISPALNQPWARYQAARDCFYSQSPQTSVQKASHELLPLPCLVLLSESPGKALDYNFSLLLLPPGKTWCFPVWPCVAWCSPCLELYVISFSFNAIGLSVQASSHLHKLKPHRYILIQPPPSFSSSLPPSLIFFLSPSVGPSLNLFYVFYLKCDCFGKKCSRNLNIETNIEKCTRNLMIQRKTLVTF